MMMNENWRKSMCKFNFKELLIKKREISSRQMERDKKTLTRYDQQRTRDAEMLRTVSENLERAFYTNDSIATDMVRETDKLKKEEDGIRVSRSCYFYPIEYQLVSIRLPWKRYDDKFMMNQS